MVEKWEGVKLISLLMGLSGIFLLTSLLWSGLWFGFFPFPYGLIVFNILFPLRFEYIPAFLAGLLPPLYGAVESQIAYGLWKKKNWSRTALVCFGVFWVVYAIWDSLSIYGVDWIVVATAVYFGVVIVYLFFSKNAKAYFDDKTSVTATEMKK